MPEKRKRPELSKASDHWEGWLTAVFAGTVTIAVITLFVLAIRLEAMYAVA